MTPPVRVDLPLVLLVLAMFLGPFYVLPSGYPQPGDVLMALSAVALLVANRGRLVLPRAASGAVGFLLAFAVYTMLVSVFWSFWTGDVLVLKPIAFYGYNAFISLSILSLLPRYGPGISRVLTTVPALAMVVLLVLAIGTAQVGGMRQTLMFNNPNQLAYFAVLAASQFFAAPRSQERTLLVQVGVLVLAFVLIMLSASRAGTLAMLPLAVHVALRARGRGVVVAIGAVLAVLAVLVWVPDLTAGLTSRVYQNVSLRGHDRLLAYPQHLFLGAGEYAVWRFEHRLEVHSSAGTLLFSYGIVGFVLYYATMLQPAVLGGWRLLLPLLPGLVFGLLHQGLRFTEMWVLFAVLMLRAIADAAEDEAARGPAAAWPPAPVPWPARAPPG